MPKLTLRTVIVSRAPPCLRAITTPSKAWRRSFVSDSLIRTNTRTVSPGPNSGILVRNCVFSTLSKRFIDSLQNLYFVFSSLCLVFYEFEIRYFDKHQSTKH